MANRPSRDVLKWRRKLNKAKTIRDIVKLIASMSPPVNCTHEAYIVCLSLAAVDYTKLLKKEEVREAQG